MAFAPALSVPVAVDLVWLQVRHSAPVDVVSPVPCGPGALAVASPPTSEVTVAAVPRDSEVDAAVACEPVQSPVDEGTALLPVEMATRLEPQLAAWARWRLRLSWS